VRKIKAVVFDLDDTLYDRDAAQRQIIRLIVRQFPQVFQGLSEERIIKTFLESDRLTVIDFDAGQPSDGMRDKRTRSFLKRLDLKEDNAAAITEMYVRMYPEINVPVPGAVEMVKALRERFSLGVITNGLPDVQYRKIEAIGLGGLFSTIILSEEIGIRKPDPRIFQMAARALKVQPEECLFVGDSHRNDVIGSKAAGMQSCWYNRDNYSPDNTDVKADLIISRLEELPEQLKRITE
jgi:HAD superfamily hydrolase (TIGR02253 family)